MKKISRGEFDATFVFEIGRILLLTLWFAMFIYNSWIENVSKQVFFGVLFLMQTLEMNSEHK